MIFKSFTLLHKTSALHGIFALGDMVIFLSGERVRPSKLSSFVNTIFLFCRIIFFILLFSFLPNTGSNTEQSIAIRSNQSNL